MNILFLELSKVINTNVDNIFTSTVIEGKLYNYKPEFIENINKLIKKFDFYLVITNKAQKSLKYDDMLYHLSSIGIEANRVIGSLHTSDKSKMASIQEWYQSQKASIDNYLVLDNFENIDPSPIENIYQVINGLNNSEFDKVAKRFEALVKANADNKEAEKEISNKDVDISGFSAELIAARNELTIKEKEEDKQTKEALLLLDHHKSYFSKEYKDEDVFEARSKLKKYLINKFPKANTDIIDKALTKKMFISENNVSSWFTIPVTILSGIGIFLGLDYSILMEALITLGVFVAADVSSYLALKSKLIQPHT